jgi:hypothetical protein
LGANTRAFHFGFELIGLITVNIEYLDKLPAGKGDALQIYF